MHKVSLDKKQPVTLKIANFFGALGYLSLLLEWLWVFGLLLYPQVKNLSFILPDSAPAQKPQPSLTTIDSTFALIIGTVVTMLCLLLIIYTIYRVPREIAKTSSRAAHVAASTVIPSLTRHKHISKKESKRLTFAVVSYLKAAAIILPLLVCVIIPDTLTLSKQIISIVAVFIAAWAIADFGIQLAFAKIAKLDTSKIW